MRRQTRILNLTAKLDEDANGMRLQWIHEKCGKRACDGTTNCVGFPTVKDPINMAKAAYEQYAESDGTSVIDFALDVLLFTQSEHDSDKTLFTQLAKQAGREWRAHARDPAYTLIFPL